MEWIYLIFGIVLILMVVLDLAYTTLTPIGAGHLTGIMSRFVWKMFYLFAGGKGRSRMLNYAGTVTIFMILLMWLLMIWFGNTFIFAFDPNSIVHSEDKTYADFVDKFYFVGYTLSTMGYGDYVPVNSVWKIYSACISFSGLILLSIAISYVLPVVSADYHKRRLSIHIAALGTSPYRIIENSWNGKDFSNINEHLVQVSSDIMLYGQHHIAYPVIHFFHNSDAEENAALNLATLDEALSIMWICFPDHLLPNKYNILIARRAISGYLRTLKSSFIKADEIAPPEPDFTELGKLQQYIEKNDSDITKEYVKLDNRRRLLKGLLKEDGWVWEDLVNRDKHQLDDI